MGSVGRSAVLAFAVSVSLAATAARAAAMTDAESDVARLIASEREHASLKPLSFNAQLNATARAQAERMADAGTLSHSALDLSGFSPLAENVGMGASPESIHRELMGSPVHRANILGTEFTHLGVGTAETAGVLFVSQVFGRAVEPVSVSTPKPAPARAVSVVRRVETPPSPPRRRAPPVPRARSTRAQPPRPSPPPVRTVEHLSALAHDDAPDGATIRILPRTSAAGGDPIGAGLLVLPFPVFGWTMFRTRRVWAALRSALVRPRDARAARARRLRPVVAMNEKLVALNAGLTTFSERLTTGFDRLASLRP